MGMQAGEGSRLAPTVPGPWAGLPLEHWDLCGKFYGEMLCRDAQQENRLYLPAHHESVSDRADSRAALVNVYADAIEFHGPAWEDLALSYRAGLYGLAAAAAAGGAGLVWWMAGSMAAAGLFLALALSAVLLLGCCSRAGFREQPVIFDRARRRVYVFRDTSAGRFWRPPSCRVDTYDWEALRVFITAFPGLRGLLGREPVYVCRLMASAPAATESGRAAPPEIWLDFRGARQEWRSMLARWEYVRRYMQREIEAVPAQGAESVLAPEGIGGPVPCGRDRPGLFRCVRATPVWPDEILAILGPSVSRAALAGGWRDHRAGV